MTTRTWTQAQMAAWDAGTLEYIVRQANVQGRLDRLMARAHQVSGDRKRGFGGSWISTDAQVLQVLAEREDAGALLGEIREHQAAIQGYRRSIDEREAVWEAAGSWSRYFPCLNRDGHIHSSMYGCKTVSYETHMGWATEISGLTVEQAVTALGETLCSVCFPDAPAEWCRTRSEVTRAEREAAKAAKDAARDAVKALKELTREQSAVLSQFAGERVTTVAAAKVLIRSYGETEIELEWNRQPKAAARWQSWERYRESVAYIEAKLARQRAAAEQAMAILADREAALPGSGWTRTESEKALDGARKRTRKAYGL